VDREAATAGAQAAISFVFQARRVFLVAGSERRPGAIEVLLDGEPIAREVAGQDVSGARATVGAQRLYRLVDLPRAGAHTLELRFERGISGYAFTFG
jgi:hypothetical protein